MRIIISIIALAALAATGARARPLHAACPVALSDQVTARRAFFFAFPLYEMMRTRQRMLSAPGAAPNRLLHRTALSTPADRSITTPNNDTLYSTAWLDLGGGPVRLSIPDMGERYHSIQLMDMFSDAFAVLRNEGQTARRFLIVGPHWRGRAQPGETIVRSPTRDAWLVGRTFVQGPDDLAAAQRLQAGYSIATAHTPEDGGASLASRPDAEQLLAAVNAALSRGPVPKAHAVRLDCFATAGIVPGDHDTFARLTPAMRQAWHDSIDSFHDAARQAFENAGTLRGGCRYPAANIARFGTDDVYRTAMAVGGLAAMPIDEAINPITMQDDTGQPLTGARRYRLRVPGDVPVAGFWSLTLYKSDGAGHWFLHANPIDRYAIGSNSAGLVREADGSIIVEIANEPPAAGGEWLPAPTGRFLLVLRAYRPGRAMRDGRFVLPPVEMVNSGTARQ